MKYRVVPIVFLVVCLLFSSCGKAGEPFAADSDSSALLPSATDSVCTSLYETGGLTEPYSAHCTLDYRLETKVTSQYGDCRFQHLTLCGTYDGIEAVNESLQEDYTAYNERLKTEYLPLAEERASQSGYDFFAWENSCEYSVIWCNEQYVSLLLTRTWYAGESHRRWEQEGRVYDLNMGKQVALEEFFTQMTADELKIVLKAYLEKNSNGTADETGTAYSTLIQNLDTAFDTVDFYVDGQFLYLITNPDSATEETLLPQTFTIPRFIFNMDC